MAYLFTPWIVMFNNVAQFQFALYGRIVKIEQKCSLCMLSISPWSVICLVSDVFSHAESLCETICSAWHTKQLTRYDQGLILPASDPTRNRALYSDWLNFLGMFHVHIGDGEIAAKTCSCDKNKTHISDKGGLQTWTATLWWKLCK